MHISISPSKLTRYNFFKQHTKLFHRQDTYFFLQHSNVKNLEREWTDNVIEQVQAIASIPSKPLAVPEFRFDLTTKSAAYNWTIDKKYGSLFNAIDTQDGTTMGDFFHRGHAWRFRIPTHLHFRATLNFFEFIASTIVPWIDIIEDNTTL